MSGATSDFTSFIPAVAETLGLQPTSDAVRILAPDVDYRIREIIQEATKFARHSNRTQITTEDVNNALKLRNVEPVYGFGGRDPARFVRAAGHPDVIFIEDPPLPLASVIATSLPRTPWEADILPHWLAVEGIQPAIPENAPLAVPHPAKRQRTADQLTPTAGAAGGAVGGKSGEPDVQQLGGAGAGWSFAGDEGVLIKAPMRQIVPRELELYYNKIMHVFDPPVIEDEETGEITKIKPGPHAVQALLASVLADPGLQRLVPYLSQLIANHVVKYLESAEDLHLILSLTACLASNTNLDLSAYLHEIAPPVLTCLLSMQLGAPPQPPSKSNSVPVREDQEHWAVRDHAAQVITKLCRVYDIIKIRTLKQLVGVLTDRERPLQTIYGAVVGIEAFGPRAVKKLLLPNLVPVMGLLAPYLNTHTTPSHTAVAEKARRVRFALLKAAAYCVFKSTVCRPVTTAAAAPQTTSKPVQAQVNGTSTSKQPATKGKKGGKPPKKEPRLDPTALMNPTNRAGASSRGGTAPQTSKRGGARRGGPKGRQTGGAAKSKTAAAAALPSTPSMQFFFSVDDDEEAEGMDIDGGAMGGKPASNKRNKGGGVGGMLEVKVQPRVVNQGKEEGWFGPEPGVFRQNNRLQEAWKDDFPLEVLQGTLVDLFGDEIEPYNDGVAPHLLL